MPSTAVGLRFVTQPTTVGPGYSIEPGVRVAVVDASGAVVTSATASITLALGPGVTSGATLTGGGASTSANGVAAFRGLRLDKRGTSYTLRATASGLSPADSRAFDVLPDVDFAASRTVAIDVLASTTRLGHLDGDGVLDVVFADTVNHQMSYRLGLGSGRYGPSTKVVLTPTSSGRSLQAAMNFFTFSERNVRSLPERS